MNEIKNTSSFIMSALEYVLSNLDTINFFKFVLHFKYSRAEKDTAMNRYLSALDTVEKEGDSAVKKLVQKKRKEVKV